MGGRIRCYRYKLVGDGVADTAPHEEASMYNCNADGATIPKSPCDSALDEPVFNRMNYGYRSCMQAHGHFTRTSPSIFF